MQSSSLTSDDVFFGVLAPEGYESVDEAEIAAILSDLRWVTQNVADIDSDENGRIKNLETIAGAIALETLAGEIRAKVAKGG